MAGAANWVSCWPLNLSGCLLGLRADDVVLLFYRVILCQRLPVGISQLTDLSSSSVDCAALQDQPITKHTSVPSVYYKQDKVYLSSTSFHMLWPKEKTTSFHLLIDRLPHAACYCQRGMNGSVLYRSRATFRWPKS